MTHALHKTCCDVVTRRTRTARGRRGLSLLEVLVSMFVLLFGLLGVAALFPLGQFHVSRASRYDRAAAVGQAAFNEIKVRGLLQPAQWSYLNGAATFPIRAQFDPLGPGPSSVGLPRVTLPGLVQNVATPSDSGAWHVFVSRDDLVTTLPPSRDLPAVQFFNTSRSYSANYSWMFTICPSDTSSEFLVVSVAVFHRRNPANEVNLGAAPNGGVNGGFVSFTATSAQSNLVKAGNWCLFSQPATNGLIAPFAQPFYRWFRLESEHFLSTPGGSYVQLAGPSWDPIAIAAAPGPRITIFDSVVAVYEKLIRVETPSDWSW